MFDNNLKTFKDELDSINIIFNQINEREKTMVQTGSIEQKSQVSVRMLEDITNLINNFNQAGAALLARPNDGSYQNYKPEYVQQLVKDETEKHLNNFLPKAEKSLKDAMDWLKLSIKQKEEIRFPLRAAVDTNKAQLGEMKSMRAQNFVSAANFDLNILMNELFTALRSGDTDYFNSLVNCILMTEPRDPLAKSDLLSSKPERNELYAKTRNVYNEFAANNSIGLLDLAATNFTTAANEANQLVMAIKAGNVYFLPKRTLDRMDQNEVSKNIDLVNASVPFYETKLDGLNFVHQLV